MKFILATIGVAALAGGGAVIATGLPSGPASALAGDWRCNDSFEGVEGSTLLSVASDGSTRAQFLFNSPYKGRWVIVNLAYSGSIRIEGDELVETARDVRITHGSIDGKPLPEAVKAAMLKEITAGTVTAGEVRNHLDVFAGSDLRFSDERGGSICERSPVKLNL